MRISKLLFTNTPLDDLEEDNQTIFASLDENEICHMCSSSFNLMNTKYICNNCRMPVCLKDSSYCDSKSRICDNCLHQNLVDEVWKEKKAIKDQIIYDIQKAMRDSQVKREVISKESERIPLIKEKISKYLSDVKEQEELLEVEIDERIKENNEKEKNIEKLIIEGKVKQELEIDIVDKMAKAHEKLQMERIEMDEVLLETNEIRRKIDEEKEMMMIMEWKDVKAKLCRICTLRYGQNKEERMCEEVSKNVCACVLY
ncbi:hypothetical protein SteCoe_21112 [Stentor coeruleus]|uniref:Uncharacterized protein n=1 Tax=Stentor coeruleus TaxID=5963 RepID=A0A1R2BQA2_9CILI|nr:hypothetical protein SteCoe_21112 [Stentor coeruleus]